MISKITQKQMAKIRKLAENAVGELVQEALISLDLDSEQAESIIHQMDEFGGYFEVNTALNEMRFWSEEVASDNGYPSDYQGPKSINDQIDTLKQRFPRIGSANEELISKINSGEVTLSNTPKRFTEEDRAFWCIPHWSLLGKTYNDAVWQVLERLSIGRHHDLYDRRHTRVTRSYLKETKEKSRMMNELRDKQGADILIVEAQFGLRHRGRCVDRALRCFTGNEFGLGTYEVAIMLLLSPERLSNNLDRLEIDCPGDICRDSADDKFDSSPVFGIEKGKLNFGYGSSDEALYCAGSASAFIPS